MRRFRPARELRRRLVAPTLVVATFLSTACGATSGEVGANVVPSVSPAGAPIRYVAIGASESVGYGAENPATQAWPQVFYRSALPRASVFVDLGIPGATVAEARARELPEAVALSPQLVTVWLNANDLIHGVPLPRYQAELTDLLTRLRQAGARWILVANTPPLARLPVYQACRPYAPDPQGGCDTSVRLPRSEVDRAVASYNQAISEAAAAADATVVDLDAALSAVPGDQIPQLISSDGFHPNAAGYRLIAGVFATAFDRLVSAGGTDGAP